MTIIKKVGSNTANLLEKWVRRFGIRKLIDFARGPKQGAASISSSIGYAVWEEPNRADTPPLHIAKSGERYSTLTGVWWLGDDSMIVAHRSGLRMAVFDLNEFERPVWTGDIEHLSDDIAAKRTGESTWEIAVSGCWACVHSQHELVRNRASGSYDARSIGRLDHDQRDFCHGVGYGANGTLCYTIHTGKVPRIVIGSRSYKLPKPWGPRDICYDPLHKRYLAVAVNANPKKASYASASTSLWSCNEEGDVWECVSVFEGVHSDALDIWQGYIWIPDQLNDQLIAVDAKSGAMQAVFSGDCFDFPHGLGISPSGKIAVTNYGSSSVVVLDCEELLGGSKILSRIRAHVGGATS